MLWNIVGLFKSCIFSRPKKMKTPIYTVDKVEKRAQQKGGF